MWINQIMMFHNCEPNVLLQINDTSKQSKLLDKEIKFEVTEDRVQREGEMNEGTQKAQTSSFAINNYQGCNAQHASCFIKINTAVNNT